MIKLFTFLSLFLSLMSYAQEIDEINAVQEKDEDYFFEDLDENNEMTSYFMAGCSWYCGGGIKTIIASSELNASGKNTYVAQNAHDFNDQTAWVEGKTDYGVGEFLEYTFNFDDLPDYNGSLGINAIILGNGYKKNLNTWKNNSRVKQLRMYVNGMPYTTINILDSFEIQKATFETIHFPAGVDTKVTFEITKVYPGEKYQDTAVSILVFDGVGVH